MSGEQIKTALAEWRGNVSAAAQDLKISTNNLRKRMAALCVDLAATAGRIYLSSHRRCAPRGSRCP